MVDGTHLFYRTDCSKKYNLAPPQSLEELIAASKTRHEGEDNRQLTVLSPCGKI